MDKAAKEKLVEQHMTLVQGLAAQLRKGVARGVEYEDLVSYGAKGLLEAAERFDPRHGASFSTFAYYRVRGAMMDGVRTMGWYSRADYARYRAEERVNAYLQAESDRVPESALAQEDATDLLAGLAQVLDAVASVHIVSIEAAARVDDGDAPADERLGQRQSDQHVRAAVAALPEKERQLMELYYFEDKTLEEAGAALGLSKSWACRLHARAVNQLRRALKQVA
jgi:RNA polymerase sigma factor FliA